MTKEPTLMLEPDPDQPGSRCVSIHNLHANLMASLGRCPWADRLLESVLRVRVIGVDRSADEDLPDILGLHRILETGIRFIPHFPFEPGVSYRAIFDPRPLGLHDLSDEMSMSFEFSLPRAMSSVSTEVTEVFPSGDSLPENVLRFYVCFSSPMQRGHARNCITLIGPDGRPASDVLYRPPVELWDRSMTQLTILLDPGRIKRGVGPNRALGPPLKAGCAYTLAIGSGMVDSWGRPLRKRFYKSFLVTEAVREPIVVQHWKVLSPAPRGRLPLELMFPRPLDWALLGSSIKIASKEGPRVEGDIRIDQGERRWSFTPRSRWTPGSYRIGIAPCLEDICGNNLLGAFDRPLRLAGDLAREVDERRNCISFRTLAVDGTLAQSTSKTL